ncbi:MAG: SRPBCC domain-containing protein [Gemmatimonadota bacterium]
MSDSWTHKFSFPIPAPAERIFGALTRADELEAWFAEHARVDARAGGGYRFWGRHTIGTPSADEATGTLRIYEPHRRVAFDWAMLDVPSSVTFSLAPEERDGARLTRVSIEHTLEREIDRSRAREIVDDWWRFALGNLAAYCAGHGAVMRPDFGDPNPEVRLTTTIEAPPADVFRALIEPASLNRWIARDATVEPRVGGRFDLGWAEAADIPHDGPAMQILEFERDRLLAISWPDWRGDASVPPQRVTWILEPEGEGTLVTLIHSGFVRTVDISDYPFGWGHFMSQMAVVASSIDLPAEA